MIQRHENCVATSVGSMQDGRAPPIAAWHLVGPGLCFSLGERHCCAAG